MKLTTIKSFPILALTESIPAEKTEFILTMLEKLAITQDGASVLQQKSKSALRGVAEALLEYNIVPPLGLERCYRFIASIIKVELKSKLDHSSTSVRYKKAAEKYIRENPTQ